MSMYEKHQIYVKPYDISENGVVKLPDQAKWNVVKHHNEKDELVIPQFKEAGEIKLYLLHEESSDNGFIPVISFLTVSEATSLRDQLNSVLTKE